MINFFIGRESDPPSFNPLDSDNLVNAFHIEQLVGTLVRMAPNGRYEGFLAERWDVSKDGLVWSFRLREGLTCEDGTPITSDTYSLGLKKIIRLFASHSALPLIDRLENFENFRTGSSESIGISSTESGRVLEFRFSKPVLSGFLEYAALPVMGFYCESNFNPDGKWKDNQKIISSGPFKLSAWDGHGPVTLLRRPEWTIFTGNAAGVVLHRQQIDSKSLNNPRTVSHSFLLTEDQTKTNAKVVRAIPTIFHSLVISSERNPILKSSQFRHALREALYSVRSAEPIQMPGVVSTNRFYPHMSQLHETSSNPGPSEHGLIENPLEILVANNPGPVSEYLLSVTRKALAKLGVASTVIHSNNNKSVMEVWRNFKAWDLRITSVDIGGGIENQLIKFMFCSNLGVSLPDPSGRICSLVEEFEKRYGDSPSAESMTEYIDRFDKIIEEDSAVIPFTKSGGAWILSEDIGTDFVSPTMGVPYFDLAIIK